MSDNLRYEQKMVFDALRLDEVRSWVYAHPDSFRVAYPPRQVNNIYFDTIEQNFLMDHISGTTIRSKVRYRWYGAEWTATGGQLEIKKRLGQLGSKMIQPVDGSINIEKLTWREVLQLLRSASSDKFKGILQNLSPVIINQYWREYYVSTDGALRVTLDYDMRVYDQSFGFYPNIRFPKPLRNDVIIEMKAGENYPQRIANSLARFPLRCSQYSKYLSGMEFVF